MNEKHKNTKRNLKIIGIVLLSLGAICTIVGFVNFVYVMITQSGFPILFWMMMIGLPMIGFGAMLTTLGFKKEISTYVKNEQIPVSKETYYDMKPEVKDFVDTIIKDKEIDKLVCPHCGTINDLNDNFCKKCGKELHQKVCPNCGEPLDNDSVYCQKCGTKIK